MRYYSTQRPIVPGSFPTPADNEIIEIKNFDKKSHIEEIGKEAYGFIRYKKALNPKDTGDYELTPCSAWLEEDKQDVCDALCAALKVTYNGADVVGIEYDPIKEAAIVKFQGDTSSCEKIVNIAMDSGTAIIKDVMKIF